MQNKLSRFRDCNRRVLLLGGMKLSLLLTLSTRLYYLQAIEAEQYSSLSEDNRMRLSPILPTRGKLLDREGEIIADNRQYFRTLVLPDAQKEHFPAIIAKLSSILELTEEEQEKLKKDIDKKKRHQSVLIKKNLSWEDVSKLEVHIPDLPGVVVEEALLRNYPHSYEIAHLIGYVARVSSKEYKNHPVIGHVDYRIGKMGLEKSLEDRLRGKAGIKREEVNALGTKIRELSIDKSTPGEDISVTIHAELQAFLMEQLAGKGGLVTEAGSGVVIDVTNGEILAMGSVPSFDPNQFVEGISHKNWNAIRENLDVPMINKAISNQYPPGSTFKTVVAMAGLEAGVINASTNIVCSGSIKQGGRDFHCWKKGGHGNVNLDMALAQSCNVYFYQVSKKVGVDRIAKMARKFGFGTPTGIELPSEKAGLVPNKAWKRKTKGESWYVGETLTVGIGQGFLLVTPLQMATMIARLASGGKMVTPTLIKTPKPEEDPGLLKQLLSPLGEFNQMNVNTRHIKLVLKGMTNAINANHGAGFFLRNKNAEFAFGGKTGTVQVRNRRFENMPNERHLKHHSMFIGFAPTYKPRYAMAVVVEHGGYGSSAAAPVAANTLEKVQQLAKEGKLT